MRVAKYIFIGIAFFSVMLSVIVATILVTLTFPLWGPFLYSRKEKSIARINPPNWGEPLHRLGHYSDCD
jgi:hypothetical protein